MPNVQDTSPTPEEDDADADDCLCGLEHGDDEATLDQELPVASGGVETDRNEPKAEDAEDESEIDGCELDFSTADQTSDEELPVSIGGM